MQYEQPYPEDHYTMTELGSVEWRRDLQEAAPSADELYARDSRLAERHDIVPSSNYGFDNRMPVVEGYDWGEVGNHELGLHSLQAVVNARGRNYGIATAVVDERQVTYVTAFGDKEQGGSLVGILSSPHELSDSKLAVTDPTNPDKVLFTVRRSPEGRTNVQNNSTEPVHMGFGERVPDEAYSGRFSFRSIFNGLKRAFRAERPNPDRNVLSGKMNWMTPSGTVAAQVRAMRRQQERVEDIVRSY